MQEKRGTRREGLSSASAGSEAAGLQKAKRCLKLDEDRGHWVFGRGTPADRESLAEALLPIVATGSSAEALVPIARDQSVVLQSVNERVRTYVRTHLRTYVRPIT